jgi:hypothetical protein
MIMKSFQLFEKKGKNHYARRMQISNSNLTLHFAQNGDEVSVDLRFKNANAAENAGQYWQCSFANAGFDDFGIVDGIPGTVCTVTGSRGPGRIRVDGAIDDVYFAENMHELKSIKQGMRVLVSGIHKNGKRKESFMLGSTLEASKIRGYPEIVTANVVKEMPLNDRQRQILLAGEALQGHQKFQGSKDFQTGDLIFAFDKGVHRFIKKKGKNIYYEELFNSQFKRQPGMILECIEEFCTVIPKQQQIFLKQHI